MSAKKKLRFTHQEVEFMRAESASTGGSVSGMLRGIIYRIAKEGTEAPPSSERTREIVTLIDRDVFEQATAKAAESGVSLRDAIRFELGVHDLT